MKINFDSSDLLVSLTSQAKDTSSLLASTTDSRRHSHRVAVSFLSTADHVALSIKPSVLAQEERQERLTRTIQLGFPPVSMSTKG